MHLSIPSNWSDEDILNKEAKLQVFSRAEEKYVIVINDTKDKFDSDMTLNDYFNLIVKNMKSIIENCKISKVSSKKINGRKCKYISLKGSVSKMKIIYWLNVIETKNSFAQIVGWTSQKQEKMNKGDILKVINSFKYKT